MARFDAHQPSALIPTNYAFIVEFWPARFNMDGEVVDEGSGYEELDEVISKHTGEVFGTEKKCGSCGARFAFGKRPVTPRPDEVTATLRGRWS